MSIATDADGYTRPQGSTTDMGAYLANGTRNNPPTISTISPQTTSEDTATGWSRSRWATLRRRRRT